MTRFIALLLVILGVAALVVMLILGLLENRKPAEAPPKPAAKMPTLEDEKKEGGLSPAGADTSAPGLREDILARQGEKDAEPKTAKPREEKAPAGESPAEGEAEKGRKPPAYLLEQQRIRDRAWRMAFIRLEQTAKEFERIQRAHNAAQDAFDQLLEMRARIANRGHGIPPTSLPPDNSQLLSSGHELRTMAIQFESAYNAWKVAVEEAQAEFALKLGMPTHTKAYGSAAKAEMKRVHAMLVIFWAMHRSLDIQKGHALYFDFGRFLKKHGKKQEKR